MKGLTTKQVSALRDAVYKIADAQQAILDIQAELESSREWYAHGDIVMVANVLDEQLTGDQGCIHHYLKTL